MKRLLSAVALTHGVLVVAVELLARRGLGGPPTALLATAWPLWAPLALLFFPLALWARSRPAIAAQGAALLVIGAWVGPLLLPPRPVAGDERLRFMTFNTALGAISAEGLVALLDDHAPDVVALQEVVPALSDPLPAALGERYPHRVLSDQGQSTALLSRFPITSHEWITPSDGGRAALRAELDRGGEPLVVYALHPRPPGVAWIPALMIPIGVNSRAGQRQIIEIAERANAEGDDVVLLGDFNAIERSPAIARLGTSFTDAFRAGGKGMGFTFPNGGLPWRGTRLPGPLLRIDYLFHSRSWRSASAVLECDTPSDHCALVVELAR